MRWSILAVLLSAGFAQAQTAPPTCSAATLSGTRSFVLTGRGISVTASGTGISSAYQGVGTASFDGNGNVTLSVISTTAASTAATPQTLKGTYAIPANCIGTVTITGGDTALFTLIPYNSGKNFTMTGTDANYAYTASGATQPAACLPASLSGPYGFTGTGYTLASGKITALNGISGLMFFDGVSAVTGSWTISTQTGATPDSLTGTYTFSNATCTASAALTDSNNITYNLSFTITSAAAADFSAVISNATYLSTATGHSSFTNPGLAVEQAAGDGLPVPPGSLFSIYGSDLAANQGQFTGFPMPTTLAQASVTVNNEAVPLYYVEGGLINAQMPWDVTPGLATLVVKNGSNVSNSVAINISATPAPAVFIYGANHTVAQNLPSYVENSTSNPAPAGSTIVVYFTGGGAVQTTPVSGKANPDADDDVTGTYSATIDGVTCTIDYVGLVPTSVGGFYQANIRIPTIAAGSHDLILTVGGKASNTTVISTN